MNPGGAPGGKGASEPGLRGILLGFWGGYLLLAVFLSLLPFELEWRSPAEAWRAFLSAPDMQSPFGSRVDWASNVVLAFPGGLLLAAALGGWHQGWRAGLRMLLALGLTMLVAPVLEFLQVYVPERVPARNDILAQWLGGFLGVMTWALLGKWAREVAASRPADPHRGVEVLGAGYLLAYLGMAFFPFDFTFSAPGGAENGGWLTFLEPSPCGPACLAGLAAEALLALPIGWALGIFLQDRGRGSPGRVAGAAFLFAAVVELIQGALAHETTEILSILTRAAGILGGYAQVAAGLYPRVGWLRRHASALWGVGLGGYLVLLAVLNGWFGGPLRNPDEIAGAMLDLDFTPLRSYGREVGTLGLVVGHALMYAPVGLFCWLRGRLRGVPGALGCAFRWGVVVALSAEAGALLFAGQEPHPWSLVVSPAAAAGMFVLLRRVARTLQSPGTAPG
ncbi:MAG: VanZ family protein [Thiohalorhabdus sp.]|uniref:VanZ family protein n=1 Tax=Thiohalorhabdus sp. TaxID=3094134 RepID=UPI00397F6550